MRTGGVHTWVSGLEEQVTGAGVALSAGIEPPTLVSSALHSLMA